MKYLNIANLKILVHNVGERVHHKTGWHVLERRVGAARRELDHLMEAHVRRLEVDNHCQAQENARCRLRENKRRVSAAM